MIHLNLLQEAVQPRITRMPAAEFGGGRVGEPGLHIHEIQLSNNLTIVMDEQQIIELTEACLDALPDQSSFDLGPDKGDEWKGEQRG